MVSLDNKLIFIPWYKHLLGMQKFMEGIEINGKLLQFYKNIVKNLEL